MEASWWERQTEGEIGSCSDGWGLLSKSLIQFSVDGWGCVPSLLFDLRPNCGGGNEDNGNLLRTKVPCTHCCAHCCQPCSKLLVVILASGDVISESCPYFKGKTTTHMDINDSADSWFTFGSLVMAGAVWRESRWVVSDFLQPHELFSPWNSPGQITGSFPFSRGYSQPRDRTQVCHVAGRFFTSWATRKGLCKLWWLYGGVNGDLLQEGLCHTHQEAFQKQIFIYSENKTGLAIKELLRGSLHLLSIY